MTSGIKITAICGSPRIGNTLSVLKSLRNKNPEIEFRIISLTMEKLAMCRGCYTCVRKGEDKCPLRDDRDEILQAMIDSDGLILASPVYSHMISGMMKNFIDRVGYLAHRPQFFDKFAMAMTTYSGFGTEEATKYMEKMLCSFGFNMVPPLELKCLPGSKSEKNEALNQKTAQNAFTKLVERIRKGERDKPSIGKLIPFGVFKYVSEIGEKEMPADYEYYKDKGYFYYDVKIPFHKKMIARKILKKITTGFAANGVEVCKQEKEKRG